MEHMIFLMRFYYLWRWIYYPVKWIEHRYWNQKKCSQNPSSANYLLCDWDTLLTCLRCKTIKLRLKQLSSGSSGKKWEHFCALAQWVAQKWSPGQYSIFSFFALVLLVLLSLWLITRPSDSQLLIMKLFLKDWALTFQGNAEGRHDACQISIFHFSCIIK